LVLLNQTIRRKNPDEFFFSPLLASPDYSDCSPTRLGIDLVPLTAIAGSDVTARFGQDGRMTGHSECNWYSALYTIQDYAINLSRESVTSMLCWDPGIIDQESAFLADLSEVSSFRVSESSLKFYDNAGKTVLVFVPA
jgi:heat shock protein HslJ